MTATLLLSRFAGCAVTHGHRPVRPAPSWLEVRFALVASRQKPLPPAPKRLIDPRANVSRRAEPRRVRDAGGGRCM
jgi:hypothetical protein